MGIPFHKSTPAPSENPESLLLKAQSGDEESRNRLITNFTPFILRVTAAASGRFIRLGSDDEASIGLIAFNEAITSYREEKGVSFLSFAETVIRRRLIDYFRKESKAQNCVPFSALGVDEDENEEGVSNRIEVKQASEVYQTQSETKDRQAEIIHYSKLLLDYGISFAELVELSPKHEDARIRAIQVARIIAENEEYQNYLKTKKSLPLKALEEQVDISRKTLERQRKYIIALAIIFIEKLEFLRVYIDKK